MKTHAECPVCSRRLTLRDVVFSKLPKSMKCRGCGSILHLPNAPMKALKYTMAPLFWVAGAYGGWHAAAGYWAEVSVAIGTLVAGGAITAVCAGLFYFNRCRFELKPPPLV